MITHTKLLQSRLSHLKLFALLLLAGASGVAYAADPGKGSVLYATNCATCHGATGVSVMPGAPSFTFGANQSLLQPDLQLLSSIKSGKNAMPAFRGILSDADILDVIAHLRTFN